MGRLSVIPGGGGGQFACPWCGATFARRFIASDGVASLEEHWLVSPACSANRSVNNPTQSKYDVSSPDDLVTLPDSEDRDA